MDVEAIAPSDIEAEKHVIGACLLSTGALGDAMVRLTSADFFCAPYGWMFNAAMELAMKGQPVNTQTVIRALAEQRNKENTPLIEAMGGGGMVVECIEGVHSEDIAFWIDRVKKKAGERSLLDFGVWVQKQALSNPADIDAIRVKVEERLLTINGGDTAGDEIADGHEGLDELTARIDRYIDDPDSITGLEMRWPILDRYLDGLQAGNVTILYAPSSRYKSFVAANIGWRLARQGIPGLWYTTEMPKVQTQERVVQLECALNFKWLRRDHTIGEHRAEIKTAIRTVANYPIYYSKRGELDVTSVRAEVMRQVRWNGIKYVIIDLVDMVSSSQYGDNDISNQAVVMKKMKSLAKKANVHILLVTHVAKGDKALKKAASLEVEEMKGSSAKYQDVDAAISIMPVRMDSQTGEWMGLDRKQIQDTVKEKGVLVLLFAITKNRHGELGELPFAISLHKGGRITPMVDATWRQQTLPQEPTICTEEDLTDDAA